MPIYAFFADKKLTRLTKRAAYYTIIGMKTSVLSEKLNGKIRYLSVKGKDKFFEFREGDFEKLLLSFIKEKAFGGKVVVSLGENYMQTLKKTFERVSAKSGCTFIYYVSENNGDNNKDVYSFFNFPEDTRAAITFGGSVFDGILLFGALKNIPVCYVPTSFADSSFFRKFIRIGNGTEKHKESVESDRYVFIDDNLLKGDLYNAYAFVMSKLIAVLDYKINRACGGKNCYDENLLITGSVSDAFGVFKVSFDKREALLAESYFTVCIADYFADNEFSRISSALNAAALYGDCSVKGEFNAFLKILPLSDISFNQTPDNFDELPDYNRNVDFMEENFGLKKSETRKIYQYQTESLNRAKIDYNLLKGLIKDNASLVKTIYGTFLALGGEKITEQENADIRKAVKFSGDSVKAVNVMTCVRENGVTELL